MASQFVPTASNMVASVRNIIQGYRTGGALRALAQEPVQNSKDAAPRGHARVEYRLHRRRSMDGTDVYMLTVTDSNTTGLQGPIRSLEEIAAGAPLSEGQNWAAFEGMGYTKKSSEEALGSRGQGKAAYLYHSQPGQERMLMLYDTLLPGGEYRLGVRYANPGDVVLNPPLLGDEARSVIQSSYAGHGVDVELGLEPLTQVGTRIIVPHLSEEATRAMRSGELLQWLQHCWWRAVQVGLSITVVPEDGSTEAVSVPWWWEGEPWRRNTSKLGKWENVAVGDGLKIKRIVLLYNEALSDTSQQPWGVQLLRGQQWIETLGQESLGDYVPRDQRPGFRGFVEFDRVTERALRHAESPQHDHFDRRGSGVKELIEGIESKVREFAEEQGWTTQAATRPAPARESDAALEFLRFLSPHRRTRRGNGSGATSLGQMSMNLTDRWECDLLLDYPDARSTRVNWGDSVRNVGAAVRLEAASVVRHAHVSLELDRAGDSALRLVVAQQEITVRDGAGYAHFGDFRIITGVPHPNQLQCSERGKWRLTARVKVGGAQVATSSRSLFVNEDPPERSIRPYTLSISVENHTTGQRRINSGDTIGVQISVRNQTSDDATFQLTASLEDLLLADMQDVSVAGVPSGAVPPRVAEQHERIVVNPAAPSERRSVDLLPGRQALRADLWLNGAVVAHAERRLDIEVDPAQAQDWPPFRIEQIVDGRPNPRWRFDRSDPESWVLYFPSGYPLYRALSAAPASGSQRLAGVEAFVVDVCAEGIIEWAMEPLGRGDRSRLEVLLGGTPDGANGDRWADYCEKMEELVALRGREDRLDEYNLQARACAALSLNLFEEHE